MAGGPWIKAGERTKPVHGFSSQAWIKAGERTKPVHGFSSQAVWWCGVFPRDLLSARFLTGDSSFPD